MYKPTRTGTSVLALVAMLMLFPTRHPTASPDSEDVRLQMDSIPSHNVDTETLEEVEVLHTYQEDSLPSHLVRDRSQLSHAVEEENILSENEDLGSLHTEQLEEGGTEVPEGYHDVPIVTTVDDSEVVSEHNILSDSNVVEPRDTAADMELHEEGREGEGEGGVEVPSGTDEVDIAMATESPISGLPEPPTIPTTDIPHYDLFDPEPPEETPTADILGSEPAVDDTPTLPPEAIQYTDVPTEALPVTDSEATPTEISTEEGEEEADDVPTFTEFSQRKRMEQDSSQKIPTDKMAVPLVSNGKNNYASLDCGAKIVASNEQSQNPSAILSENKDNYMINPCSSQIWFIVELCELVELHSLQIACFELFSSIPKSFDVSVSERWPSDEWRWVGTMHASNEREVQSFPLATDEPNYAKYVRVEMLSHYGSEHFCPLSLLRVVGASMMEVYEYSESQQELQVEPSSPTVAPTYHEDSVEDDLFGSSVDDNATTEQQDLSEATGLTHIVADVVMNLLQKVNGYISSHPVPEDQESLESRGDIASATDQPDTTR